MTLRWPGWWRGSKSDARREGRELVAQFSGFSAWPANARTGTLLGTPLSALMI